MAATYNNDSFLEALEESKEGVWLIARWLSDQGHHVKVNAVGKAPTVGERYQYTDGGDLEICQRIEVKHISASFTCAEDWPYAYMIVCNRATWDASTPKPHAVIHLNKEGTHAAIVKGSDFHLWQVRKISQKGEPFPHDVLTADVSTVKYVQINKPADKQNPSKTQAK